MTLKKLLLLCTMVGPTLMAQNDKFLLIGKTSGIEDGTYLYLRDLANGGNIDSALVANNTFRFTTDLPEPILFVMLFTKDKANFTPLWLENRPMTFDATNGDFKKARVTGSKNHALAKEMKKTVYANVLEISDEIKKQREMDFIARHPGSLVSAYILTSAPRHWSQDEVAAFYARLTPGIQASSIGRKVVKYLEKDAAEVGDRFVDVSAVDSKGNTVKISQLTGNLTLLQFWSSGCGYSRIMNRTVLTKVYPVYHSKGFEVVTISEDVNMRDWLTAIQEDNFNWSLSNNLNSPNGQAFKDYGVLSTPSNFLINSEGIIVARNLMGEELEKKIIEHLDK